MQGWCRTATDPQTLRLSDLQTFRPSDLQTLRLSDLQTFRPSDFQTFRPSDPRRVSNQPHEYYCAGGCLADEIKERPVDVYHLRLGGK